MPEPKDDGSNPSAKFTIFRGFEEELRWAARSTFQLDEKCASELKSRDPLVTRIVEALGKRRAINVKEVLESFETFARIRRRVRAPSVADLCCGHGLTGLLFAAIERRVERVTLLDRGAPPKAGLVLEAIVEAAPWAADKVRWVEAPIERAAEHLDPHTSIVAVHACGVRTDRAIDAACAIESDALALMPCCYKHTAKRAPRGLRDALGPELATDVARTYRLEAAGYDVEWATIPEAITPMNRVLVALKRGRAAPSR